ncbi:MAG: N-acetylmuramic acid-6-phosphate etherase, partial [Planctomycetota bacterium]
LDLMPTAELLAVMNDEDHKAALAVRQALPEITRAATAIAERMQQGGRLVYAGAGTSGRLGVLDAAECGPTFSAQPGQVVGLIAGGSSAMLRAVEGAEDDPGLGKQDLEGLGLGARDCVVGIAASGRTPYVIGALAHARSVGALPVAVVCSPDSPVAAAADIAIVLLPGPEVLTGSTRLKAGTATKLVLNMLSTGAFVRLHKVYGNLMVDLQATNEKLVARSRRIVAQATDADLAVAETTLAQCDGEVKTAIVVLRKGVDAAQARTLLFHCEGSVRAALHA